MVRKEDEIKGRCKKINIHNRVKQISTKFKATKYVRNEFRPRCMLRQFFIKVRV